MPTPHKHAEVIKAWADGYEIQYRNKPDRPWETLKSPSFVTEYEYRKKPEEVVDYAIVYQDGTIGEHNLASFEDLRNNQGVIKRTRVDGQVVSLEFSKK